MIELMARTSEPGLMRRVAGSSPHSARYLIQLSVQVTNGAIETGTKVERARSQHQTNISHHRICCCRTLNVPRRPHWNTSLFYEPQHCLRPHKSAAPQTKLRSHWFIPQRLLIASFNTPGLTGKGGFVTKSYYHTWTRLLIKPYNQRLLIQIRLPIQCYNLSRL